jgi:sugar (pentulose or hexulose) kinase
MFPDCTPVQACSRRCLESPQPTSWGPFRGARRSRVSDPTGSSSGVCTIRTVVPKSIGAISRCIIDSLALSYRKVLDGVTEVTASRPPAVNIVGGGSSHSLLSQLTADATGLPVQCGPVEATALGNAAVQLVAAGELEGLDDIRRVVAASTDLVEYQPRTDQDWELAIEQFTALTAGDLADPNLTTTSISRVGKPEAGSRN